MTNTSEILQTIRQNIEGWNPNTAELEILSQSLSKSVDSRGELNGQDLVHLEIIVKQVISHFNHLISISVMNFQKYLWYTQLLPL